MRKNYTKKFNENYFILLLITVAFSGCLSGAKPVLNNVNPMTVFPRQIVAIDGTDLDFSYVQWDPNLPSQKYANSSLLNAHYFQIPEEAATGAHSVRLSNYWGFSTSSVSLKISPLSGEWPAPRIEDITYHLLEMNTTTNTMTLLLYLAVANVDAKAEVNIGGIVKESALYSAIPSGYFNGHTAETFNYPVYHYGQLIVSISGIPGTSFDIRVKNIDGKTADTNFTLPANEASLDSDNDGLLDKWEINGYPRPSGSGPNIDLKGMGCDPYKKDILLEVDWVPKHTDFSMADVKPMPAIWDDITQVYLNAPVMNPDGSQGINIHIDRGQGGVFMGGGTAVDYYPTMDFKVALPTDTQYACFYDLKKKFFDADRTNIFHYCIIGYRSPAGDIGYGEIWGNDFMITPADFQTDWASQITEVGCFVHELGHNLSLRHGGINNLAPDADSNYKPNLPSTMNYRYQKSGISTDCDLIPEHIQTYSEGMLKPLFENMIIEKKWHLRYTRTEFRWKFHHQFKITNNRC